MRSQLCLLFLSVSLSVSLSGSMAAQGALVTPSGYATVEGTIRDSFPFTYRGARLQQVDGTTKGTARPGIKSIAFRRDSTLPDGTPRLVNLEIVMGEADYATFDTTFAANYRGTPSTTMATKSVFLPDFKTGPTQPPAPFDLVLPFDAPWSYTGVDDLMFELRLHFNSNASSSYPYLIDAAESRYQINRHTTTGIGCNRSGSGSSMTTLLSYARSTTTTIDLGFEVVYAPFDAPVVLLLGTTNPNLALPGVCARLLTDGAVVISLGRADYSGYLWQRFIPLPWNQAFAGITLFTQAVAPDAGQPGIPVTLSTGNRCVVPTTQGGPEQLTKFAFETTSPAATIANQLAMRGLVAQLAW